MHASLLPWAVALVLSAAAAGCVDDGPEVPNEFRPAAAELEFDGSGSGDHEDQGDCQDEAVLDGHGDVSDGRLLVTVTDGGGDEKFSQEFTGSFTLNETALTGASGAWNLRAERSGDDLVGDEFQGSYELELTC